MKSHPIHPPPMAGRARAALAVVAVLALAACATRPAADALVVTYYYIPG